MRVKICGLRSRAEVTVAAESGAAYIGFVFHRRSPRNVSLADARWIAEAVPEGLAKVALTADAEDEVIEAILTAARFDLLQLHGSESPDRVAAVRERFGLPVMKSIGIADERDLAALDDHAGVADMLLVDARAPEADLPGGNGRPFDWRLVRGRRWPVPWMLAGGLTPQNVGEAIRLSGAAQVDVSSGVERAPGFKDPERIAAFIAAARQGERQSA